jgi:hypothetical protein
VSAFLSLVPAVTALAPITQEQFERLGENGQEVIALDRAHDAAMVGWLAGLRMGGNVLSLDAARANPKPKPTAWRGHLTRALAIACNRGGNPVGGGPRTASMGRR